jgi:septum site-determining protein MinD
MDGEVVAVASGKGGVGKTTTVVNLGVVLRRANHSVALVDADLGMANLGQMLGISNQTTLHDILAGEASLEVALVTEAAGFAILPGSQTLTDFSTADPRGLGDVLDELAAVYDYVLVDTGAGMSHEGVLPLGLADRVLLVTSPDPAAVDNTRKTADLTEMADGVMAGVVVTKASNRSDGKDLAAEIGVDLLGVIPFDPAVRRSTANGRPLEVMDPESPAVDAYRALAEALTGDSLVTTEGPSGTAEAESASTSSAISSPEAVGGPAADSRSEDAGDRAADSGDEAVPGGTESHSGGNDAGQDPVEAESTDTVERDATAPDSNTVSATGRTDASPTTSSTSGDESAADTEEREHGDEADGPSHPAAKDASETSVEDGSDEGSGFFGWLGGLFR